MLSKRKKLPLRAELREMPSGRKIGPFFIRAKSSGKASARFAVIVSKKVDKRASARNTIKRDIFRVLRKGGYANVPGYDMVIAALPEIKAMSRKDIEVALRKVFA